MKRVFLSFVACLGFLIPSQAQSISTGDELLDKAFALAVWTIDYNTHDNIIEAGAGYGGEWTRDCAINCWNAVSLFRPEVALNSLWSVTVDRDHVGHQYWDKIIWVIGAWKHYLVTGDFVFLENAYPCCKRTMKELEDYCYENYYQLFMGPAVYQDGIEAYDEPIYDKSKADQGGVLAHNYYSIKCLSTNALYYECYKILALMAQKFEKSRVEEYTKKAENLRKRIREVFYRPEQHKFVYLIDQKGNVHDYQEGLGIAFACMFGVLTEEEAADVLSNAHISQNGITAVYPSFPRNSAAKPGRHNDMVWPHVNMFFADACARNGVTDRFWFEMRNLAKLAIINGKNDFYEIYTIDGIPSGGYQCGHEWDTKEHQTWCATGYIRNFIDHILGMDFQETGIQLSPMGMENGEKIELKGIKYRNMELSITVKGHGNRVVNCKINGKSSSPFIPASLSGKVKVEIQL